MGINYTDGVKIPCSCFLFLRNQPVAASPLTLLQQIRLARVRDRWWAHASRPLWSCVIRTEAGKRKLWNTSFEGGKNATSTQGLTAGTAKAGPLVKDMLVQGQGRAAA